MVKNFEIKNNSEFIESLRNGWTIRYSDAEQLYFLCTPNSRSIIYKSKFGFESGYMNSSWKHVNNYDLAKRSKRHIESEYDLPYLMSDDFQTPYYIYVKNSFRKKFLKQRTICIEEKNNNKQFGTNFNGNHFIYSNKNDFNSLVFDINGKLLFNQKIFKEIFDFDLSIKPWQLLNNKAFYIFEEKHMFSKGLAPLVLNIEGLAYHSDYGYIKTKSGEHRLNDLLKFRNDNIVKNKLYFEKLKEVQLKK